KHPDQTVEHDFEHRQAFVGDQRAGKNGLDARGLVAAATAAAADAEQAVDLALVEHTVGDRAIAAFGRAIALLGHVLPGRRSRLFFLGELFFALRLVVAYHALAPRRRLIAPALI